MKNTILCTTCIQIVNGVPAEKEKAGYKIGQGEHERYAIYLQGTWKELSFPKQMENAELILYLLLDNQSACDNLIYQIIPTNQCIDSYWKSEIVPFIWNQPEFTVTAKIVDKKICILDILEVMKSWKRLRKRDHGIIIERITKGESILLEGTGCEHTYPYIDVQYISDKSKNRSLPYASNIEKTSASIKGIKKF